MSNKTVIRQEMRARRKELSPEVKMRAVRVIYDKIIAHFNGASSNLFDNGGALAVYLASADEIDLSEVICEMLSRGVRVVAPRWNGATYELAKVKSLKEDDLRKGPMGILEPKDPEIVSPKDVAVWLVPGLAFTRDGRRLGYGGGWYDRLMEATRRHAVKLGIAYSFQVISDLPSDSHDICVNGIIDTDILI